ncbi:MAG: carboxypeptidase-like regulatory domain-containing protein [bacterium]|nr:carboxypeptidase-like regulatory domain-containing protein [bacterium]
MLAALGGGGAAWAQDAPAKPGTLHGLIVDAETGEAMIGVAVMLDGTQQGAATDLDGNFTIRNVAPGSYTLVANYIGYAKLTVTDVAVASDQTATLNLKMSTAAIQAKEVVIEARRIDNTEASILQIQRRSSSMANGVSAEQIKKSPDSDAADAVKRVTGISVVGDKYVYVRGMGERYNNTRLNGATLASPEPLKRVVPFDIIPANLLNNIVVSKTFTPDMPGDFAGGSVQLTTKDFPEKLTFSVSQNVDYNNQSTFKDFDTYKGGDADWLGWDDGTRALPDELSNPPAGSTSRTLATSFANTWEARQISAPLNGSRSIAFGKQSQLFGRPFGYLATLTQSTSYSSRDEQEFVYNFLDDGSVETTDSVYIRKSTRTGALGGIVDLNYKASPNHKFSVKTMYTGSGDDEVKQFSGILENNFLVRATRLSWTERSLLTFQPKGEHQLSALRNSRLDWGVSFSKGTYSQPDRRDVYYADFGDGRYSYLNSNSSGFRRFAEMKDNAIEGTVDVTMPLRGKDDQSKIKFGGLIRDLDREFPTRKFYFGSSDTIGAAALDRTLPAEVLFSPENILAHWTLQELLINLDSYNAESKVAAGYAMGDLMLNRKWRAVFGARIEAADQHFKTNALPGDEGSYVEGGPQHTDVLPSLNVTYLHNDKTSFRFAVSKTVANPDYAELVPTTDSDYYEGTEKIGNPEVDYTKILNVDLRAELYPSIGENVSVGLFYKQIKDPIEWIYASGSATGSTTSLYPDNLVDASNLGVEFEFRKSLGFAADRVGSWARYFSVQGNLTLVSSTVDLNQPAYDPANVGAGILTSTDRSLMGQSDYVVNTTLAFDHVGWGTNVRLLFNTFGERISQVGGYGNPDTFEQPFERLDFAVNQSLGGHWSAKLQAKNLLDSKVEFLTGGKVQNSYKVGQSYSFGVSYTI